MLEKKDEEIDTSSTSKVKIVIKEDNNKLLNSNKNNSQSSQENEKLNNSNEKTIDHEKVKIKIRSGEHSHCKHKNMDIHRKYINIGNNVVLFGKFVCGPIGCLWILIAFLLSVAISSYLCIRVLGSFYSKWVYWYLFIYEFFMDYYMIVCYITEPGIIPRNHPDFQKNIEEMTEEEEKVCPTPRIFTERKCPTCNIIRPPGASHCAQCNNCVLDFDHHCAFVSNCVGKRNHKYFYYCLIFASLFSIQTVCLHLYAIKYVFITKYKETLYHIYTGSKFGSISLIVCILLTLMFSGNRRGFCGAFTFGLISFVLYFRMWYKYVPINENTPSYYSPFIIITLFICMGYLFFSNGNLIGQTYVVSQNLTVKQKFSIEQKMEQLYYSRTNIQIDGEYVRRKTIKEAISNIFRLICAKSGNSLIIPERDLILNPNH